MLRDDAGARVADRQRGDAIGLRRAQRDRSARRRVPQRIADEILDCLFDAIRIGDDLVGVRVDVNAYRDPLRLRVAFVAPGDVLEEPLDVEEPLLQDDAAVFVAGEVQEVFDDALEAAGLAVDRFEIAIATIRVERHLGHAQRFDVSAHRGQRRFQFM